MSTKIGFLGICWLLFHLFPPELGPLELFQKERKALLQTYSKTTTEATLQKIHAVENKIITHIADHGFKVVVNVKEQGRTMAVVDPTNPNNTLATVSHADTILVLEYYKDNAFYVQAPNGSRGLLSHYDFSPSVNNYPLNVLVAKTKALKAPSTKKKTAPKNSHEATSGCSSRRCAGRTQKGSRCKRMTTNCGGRCFQH